GTMKRPPRRRPLDQVGGDLLSREVALRVPSARAGLTSLFGMGRGVPPPLSPPKLWGAFSSRTLAGASKRNAQPSKLHSDSTCSKSRPRAISTGPLNALLRLHVPP